MTRYVFEEISAKATRRWMDADGKKRQETRKLFQTVNPFNKRPDGTPKAAWEIRAEVAAERDAWLEATQADNRKVGMDAGRQG